MNTFDLVVIGAGPGGYVAAIRAAQLGLSVACVDDNPQLGGTCLRVGCIPSKALLESSELFHLARHALASHGILAPQVQLDLPALLARKDQIVKTLAQGIESLLKKNKIARFLGRAALAGPGAVHVTDPAGAVTALAAKHILIATGSVPAPLPGVDLDGDRIGVSTHALNYPAVPRHLVVIGGGYIGLELSTVWHRLGAQVTVVEFLDHILPNTDRQLADEALQLLTRQGIDFRLGARVLAARRDGDECLVEIENAQPLRCDRVLLAVGRKPNTAHLGLDTVGVIPDRRGFIPVNDKFQTSAPGVFAVGDVIGNPMLAHKAEEEAVACVEGIVTGHCHVDYSLIPAVVFTQPEIASVGRTEEQLAADGVAYRKGVFPFRANGRARTLGHTDGRVKVLADEKTDRVLGVHILGPRAGDLIAEAAAAMAFGASSEDIARVCHAHPTLAESLKEAALAVDGRALHA